MTDDDTTRRAPASEPPAVTRIDELRGATRLAVEATKSVADLVEAMHTTIGGGPDVLGRPLERPARMINQLIYGGIRGVTQFVGATIDTALAQLVPLIGKTDFARGPEEDAVLSALNGVLGDYLADTGNPLAIPMRFRHGAVPLDLEPAALRAALPHATSKLLVLVHGSCMNDRQWTRLGHDHGAALARDHGYTPVYLHYNSGLHISTNGRSFASLLDRLVAAWPTELDDLVLLGHSMGGLVSRSACHFGDVEAYPSRRKLRSLVCLGSPHHGAALERGGSWLHHLIGVSRYSAPLAPLAKIRSCGVTDMRYGNVLDEDWQGRDRFALAADLRAPLPLPERVACYAMAATTATQPGGEPRSLPGDGLVSVDSALGRHPRPELTLAFPEAHQWIAFGTAHLDLLDRADVYEKVRDWLTGSRAA